MPVPAGEKGRGVRSGLVSERYRAGCLLCKERMINDRRYGQVCLCRLNAGMFCRCCLYYIFYLKKEMGGEGSFGRWGWGRGVLLLLLMLWCFVFCFLSFFFFSELQGPATLTLLFTFRFCFCMLFLLSVLFLQFCFVVVSYPAYSSHMDSPLASQHLFVSSFL